VDAHDDRRRRLRPALLGAALALLAVAAAADIAIASPSLPACTLASCPRWLLALTAVRGLAAAGLVGSAVPLALASRVVRPERVARSLRLVGGAWAALAGLLALASAAGLASPLDFGEVLRLLERTPLYERIAEGYEGPLRLDPLTAALILLNNFGILVLSFGLTGLVLYGLALLLVRLAPASLRPPRLALLALAAGAQAMPLISMAVNGYVLGSVVSSNPRFTPVQTLLLLLPHGALELPGVVLVAASFASLWRALFGGLLRPGEAAGLRAELGERAPSLACALALVASAAVVEAGATLPLFLLLGGPPPP
jgi:hypothetical protein